MTEKTIVAQVLSVDEQLARHLERAEQHLIEALELFASKNKPVRTSDYLRKLTRAQEMVTNILGEELVRRRGPIKLPRKRK